MGYTTLSSMRGLGVLSFTAQDEQTADAYYVAAVSAISKDPSITAILGTVAKAALNVGEQAIQKIGSELVTQIGEAVASEATEILGPEIISRLGDVATTAADALSSLADVVPLIGTAISAIEFGEHYYDAQNAAIYATDCANALNQVPQGSGPNGEVTLGDIFAYSPTAITNPDFAPISSIGRALVAVTETDNTTDREESDYPQGPIEDQTDPDWVYDTPQYHAAIVYDGIARTSYPLLASEPNVGVPLAWRKQFALLRQAIGAHGRGSETLGPIYLDMLKAALAKGYLTGGWMVWLLGHYLRSAGRYGTGPGGVGTGDIGWVSDDPGGSNPQGDGSPGPFCGPVGWTPIVNSILALAAAWKPKSSSLPASAVAAAASPKILLQQNTPIPMPPLLAIAMGATLVVGGAFIVRELRRRRRLRR